MVLFLVWSCGHPPQAAQNQQPPPPFQFLGKWGQGGTEPGEFHNPQTIACDGAGSVYIADGGSPTRVEKFDASGHPLLVFAASGNQNDWDSAVDPGGAIFVVDRRHEQVQIFTPEGEPFKTLFFRYRRDLHEPASIAMELDGDFYLSDFITGRIAEMSPAGRTLHAWSKPAGIEGRWSPYVVRLAQDGNLYVADADAQRIEKISVDGHYLASWNFPFTTPERAPDSPRSSSLAVFRDLIAASDAPKRLLQVWDSNGESKFTVDFSQHPEWGDHVSPTDIAFGPSGELFVLDEPDSTVLRFKVNIQAPANSQ